MSLTIPKQLEEFIQMQVRSGRYQLQRELDLAQAFDEELEKGFEDFKAGRFQRFDTVAQVRSEVESRFKARAATLKQ
jgi:Arc/MetJ-type ribon-helix-helix transcriptional regulator